MTPQLEAEGYTREICRQIQAFRKNLGLEKSNEIKLFIIADEELKKIFENKKETIKKRTNSKILEVAVTEKERFKNETNFKIKDKRGKIAIVY